MAGVEILYSITRYGTNSWTLALGIFLAVSAIILAGFIIWLAVDLDELSALFFLCLPVLMCCLGISLIRGEPYKEYVVHVDSEVAFVEFYDKYEITDRLDDYVYQVKEREEN